MSACSVLFCLVVCFSRLVPKSTNIGADWSQNCEKSIQNGALGAQGLIFGVLGVVFGAKKLEPEVQTVPGRFGSFGVGDFGRLFGGTWSPRERYWEPGGSPSGLKIVIFSRKLPKNRQKV